MDLYIFRLQKLRRSRTTRLVLLTALVFLVIIGFQTVLLASDSSWLLSVVTLPLPAKESLPNSSSSVVKESSLLNNTGNTTAEILDVFSEREGGGGGGGDRTEEQSTDTDDDDDDVDLGEDEHPDEEFVLDVGNGTLLKKEKDGHFVLEQLGGDGDRDGPLEKLEQLVNGSYFSVSGNANDSGLAPSESTVSIDTPSYLSPFPHWNSTFAGNPASEKKRRRKKKQQPMLGVWSMSDMDHELAKNHASARSMVPRWHSKVDRQMLYAREQIEKAPIVTADDEDLYAPIFRNLSSFKRSYELMEKILKVYVYKEGERPIFHNPHLHGIYASEGWFMKQMEENRKFVVGDPSKAHLFYMPFSSVMLRQVLYVPDSHNHKDLIEYLQKYVRTISSAHPFWNRTGGADHFLAGCHDWATRKTAGSMETAIRALCNSDVRMGFEIGKDVSLPATNVGNERDPLRNLGGKPSHARSRLAFFAGQMHGYLRPILLQHWENKHPDMIITSHIPHRVRTKTKNRGRRITRYPYAEHMKDSKFCICPRGYEVYSTRVAEAIFYGCVPVIISDNYVPPFFELLDWSAFSVILPEKDMPRLRDVLLGIGEKRYAELERGVRAVRRHFLWNPRPLKYDLFHMILHNVWFNRLHQVRVQ